ncbi:MAG: DUF4012 domain-containing protein [bacterium]|nr:DUF4012 domain-containing protein [bacterium]
MFHLSKSKHINFVALQQMADKLANGFPLVSQRRRLSKIYKILKYFWLAIIALGLTALILFSAEILSLRELISQAAKGQANLEQAVILSQADKLSAAMSLAAAAQNNFDFSISQLGEIKDNHFVNKIDFILSQLNDIESLLITAQFLSKAVYSGANFGLSLEKMLQGDKKLNFSKFSPEERHKLLGKIFESAPELNGIKADLDLAYLNLEQVNLTGALFPLKEKAEQIKNQIYDVRLILAKAVPISQLLPALAGYPEKAKYLVMLQNNDELRPTGGFLGTYGILEIQDGEIVNFDTHDIYHLDMPVKDKVNVVPPEPIKKYLVPKWYLRDANWSPDWPTSARQIDWFYQTESRLNPAAEKVSEFNGVLALTPKLITDFLEIIGPVTIEGQSYNQANFQDLLQYRVEKGYLDLGVSSWQRKEVISEIAKELKNRIFDLPPAGWFKAINVVLDNLTTKNLLLYLADSQLEDITVANGWGGEIKDVAGDYLMVVDANLGALKTDASLNRSLKYEVSQGVNGLFSKLTIGYAHHGQPDWKTSAYKSYTRIYAPLGSQLIKISGYELKQIDIGSEAGKTWFGFYLEIQPGKIKNLTVEYKLPALVAASKNYELYLQKQPGKEINETIVDLSFLNDIKSYSPASLSTQKISSGRLKWAGDLSIDRSFEVRF